MIKGVGVNIEGPLTLARALNPTKRNAIISKPTNSPERAEGLKGISSLAAARAINQRRPIFILLGLSFMLIRRALALPYSLRFPMIIKRIVQIIRS